MDILAARKKAAERARAGKAEPAPQPLPEQEPEREPERREELEPAFPPLPETAFLPDEGLVAPVAPPPTAEPAETEDRLPTAPAVSVQPDAMPVNTTDTQDGPTDEEHEDDDAEEEREQESEMLAFLLGPEEYVVPVEQVQEVLTPREITPIPHSKEFILGVCSLRGIVLPIIDLHRRLGLADAAWDERSRIIVLHLGPDDSIGLYVDRVRGVVRFPLSAMRPVPETIEQGAEFLQGIVRKNDRLFIVLDVQKTTEI